MAQVGLNPGRSRGLWNEQNTLNCSGLRLLKIPPLWEEAIEFAFPPAQLEQGFSGSQTKAMEIVWEDKEGTVWTSRKLRGEWDLNVASKQSHFYFMPCRGGGRTWGAVEVPSHGLCFGNHAVCPQDLGEEVLIQSHQIWFPLPASHSWNPVAGNDCGPFTDGVAEHAQGLPKVPHSLWRKVLNLGQDLLPFLLALQLAVELQEGTWFHLFLPQSSLTDGFSTKMVESNPWVEASSH